MKTRNRLLLLPIFLFITLLAKADYTVSGFVTDAKTGESLIGVSVYSYDKKIGGITNNYGFYSITFESKKDSVDLYFSYIGYKTQAFKIKLKSKISLNVQLEQKNDIKEVEVVADRNSETMDNPQVSRIELSGAKIKRIPAILGEPDVIKVIQLQPGVQKGSEAGTGLYVRGGTNDQNLILLDGAPLYNVSHTFNFFSVFNSDAINYVNFYKGGFPARFGERLSSVLDITMKEGNSKKFSGTFSVGTVSARGLLEGPLGKSGKTTFMISARRTYLDQLIKPLFRLYYNDPTSQGNFGYYFYDVNFKISHRISQNDRVYFSLYKGLDDLYSKIKDIDNSDPNSITTSTLKAGMNWGNIMGTVRWNHVFNEKTFANFMVDYTRYRTNIYLNYEDVTNFNNGQQSANALDFRLFNGIRDLGAKADIQYTPNASHKMNFGMQYINHHFTPGTLELKYFQTGFQPFDTTLYPSRNITSHELALYGEDEFEVNKSFKINYGVRLTSLFVDSTQYIFPEPRVSARYYVNRKWSLKLSYALVHQYIQRIQISQLGLPLDYWAPSTKYIKPQASHQIVLSTTHSLKKGVELIGEVYYKYSDNVNALRVNNNIFDISLSNWEKNVEQGVAQSIGLEVLAQKKFDEVWSGWIGYTLSKSFQRFPTINFNKNFPTDFDRRHDLSIVIMYKPSTTWSYALTYVFTTGQPYTLPIGRYLDANGQEVFEFAGRNNVRLPNTKRLDFAINHNPKAKKWGEISYDFSFYNVLFSANPSGAYVSQTSTTYKSYYRSFIPFMVPALSVNYKF